MTRSIGNIIGDSLQLSIGYANRLTSGITPANFARFAMPGGQTVESNHAAFVFGHLSLYAPRIIEQLGRHDLAVSVPAGFAEVFSKDAKCIDDPDGTVYPEMAAVMELFTTGYDKAMQALREADDATLQQPNPGEGRMVELFPTLGSMHAFYVGGHMMMHLGQLSAWRRAQGLSPA